MGRKSSIRVEPETLRSLGWASIGAAYVAVGTGFDNPSHMLWIQNLTNAAQLFSLDGVNDHFPIVAGAFLLLDVTSNRSNETGFFIAKGTTIYVKDLGVATSGSVYVTTFYGAP